LVAASKYWGAQFFRTAKQQKSGETVMTSPTPATSGRLLDALSHLLRARRRMIELNPDINFTTMVLLGSVSDLQGPRISDLAHGLLVDLSVVSRQVAGLEAEGLLRRVRDETDRRAFRVELTAAGTELLAQFRGRVGHELAARLADFTDAEITGLADGLDAVAAALCVRAAPATGAAPPPPTASAPPERIPPPLPPAPTPHPSEQFESVTR
jgi:DNA-binding MarR family transcriptional regulator